MYCRNCGSEMPDGARICPSCGMPDESSGEQRGKKSGKKRSGGSGRHIGIVILVIIVIVAVACGIFAWARHRNSVRSDEEVWISEEDAEKVMTMIDAVQEMDAQGADADDIYDYFESLPWVEWVYREDDGSISCRTEFGIIGSWEPEKEYDEYIGGDAATSAAVPSEEELQAIERYVGDGLDIVILCPDYGVDPYFLLDAYERKANSLADSANGSVTVWTGEEVSLEALTKLDEFDMVFYYAHGLLYTDGDSDSGAGEKYSYTNTGYYIDSEEDLTDLNLKTRGKPAHCILINSSSGRISVGGDFYTTFYEEGAFEDMFFHFGSCKSMATTSISDAILSLGASWMEGWDYDVTFINDYRQFDCLTEYMLEGYTAAESFALVQASEFAQEYANENCNFIGVGDGGFCITTKQEEYDVEDKAEPVPNDLNTSDQEGTDDSEDGREETDSDQGQDAGDKAEPTRSGGLFADMNGHQFYFMNGADIWNSYLITYADGSFEGIYSEWSTSVEDAQGKQYFGAYYYNEFSGTFSTPQQVGDHVYSTTVLSLNTKYTPGTEGFIGDSMHIFTEPYGIAEGDEFLIYLPETPITDLGGSGLLSAILSDLGMKGDVILGDYLLVNTNGTGVFL